MDGSRASTYRGGCNEATQASSLFLRRRLDLIPNISWEAFQPFLPNRRQESVRRSFLATLDRKYVSVTAHSCPPGTNANRLPFCELRHQTTHYGEVTVVHCL